jgi:hypothetical protein
MHSLVAPSQAVTWKLVTCAGRLLSVGHLTVSSESLAADGGRSAIVVWVVRVWDLSGHKQKRIASFDSTARYSDDDDHDTQ